MAASEEDIRSIFEEYAAQDRDMYEGNVYMYEIYKNYYGADSWYIPEGYRGIIHILLKVDSDLLSAYQTAQAAFEETVTDEAPEGDAAAKAARDEAFNAVLASKQAQIDDIYARLEKGESFADLIAEYGEDPGMQDKARLASGYEVHKDSVVWDPVFTSAAFSEKMTQPGDTSDPVVGSLGIHILHYLRDIPGGYIELSDEIRASISQYLESEKMQEIISETLSQWLDEHEVVMNQEAIDAAAAQAAAAQNDAEEAPAQEP